MLPMSSYQEIEKVTQKWPYAFRMSLKTIDVAFKYLQLRSDRWEQC